MKRLTVSQTRNTLPSLLKDIMATRESVIVTRHGKPLAKIQPFNGRRKCVGRYSLRGLALGMAKDFNKPLPELWSALQP